VTTSLTDDPENGPHIATKTMVVGTDPVTGYATDTWHPYVYVNTYTYAVTCWHDGNTTTCVDTWQPFK
jgi:hypothetical protein